MQIHCGFANLTAEEACRQAEGLDTGQYKRIVADAVIEVLSPIREEYYRIRKDEDFLDSVLENGSSQAREIAYRTWKDVQQLLGMKKYT